MNIIPKKQLYARLDALPDILREAMASDVNSQLVWKTGENEHLPKEKISTISRLTGYVLMGFIHPEDLARELHENLGIDIRVAASIAEPINRKIFAPLRDELNKVYAPATDEATESVQPQPISVDSISSPLEKLAKSAQSPSPFPPIQSIAPAQSKIPVPTPITKQTGQAAPFILHQESASQPLAPSDSKQSFKVGLSGEQFGKMEQKWVAPPKPAQIETSFVPKLGTQKTDARVVHYGEMRTPIPPVHGSTVRSSTDELTINKNVLRSSPLKPFMPNEIGMPVPRPPTRKMPQPVVTLSNPPPPNIAFSPMPDKASAPREMLPGKQEEKELQAPKN